MKGRIMKATCSGIVLLAALAALMILVPATQASASCEYCDETWYFCFPVSVSHPIGYTWCYGNPHQNRCYDPTAHGDLCFHDCFLDFSCGPFYWLGAPMDVPEFEVGTIDEVLEIEVVRSDRSS
jgi:hypothetical protein